MGLAKGLAALLLGGVAACAQIPAARLSGDDLPQDWRPSGLAAQGASFVHLFEWRWDDIARECPRLARDGYTAVQISPPQEHLLAPGAPWWQRYQPVSYSLAQSRSGTEMEFRAMVGACKAAGIAIYADAVINHMSATNVAQKGSAGSDFAPYDYPAVPWRREHFHAPCVIRDYQNPIEARHCALFGLQDMDTAQPVVQARIADYLIALNQIGVAGFRVDAAKHIAPRELDAIFTRVNDAAREAGRPLPYVLLELIELGPDRLPARLYNGIGYASGGAADITEFRASAVIDAFAGHRSLASLSEARRDWMPLDKAVVFVANHDTERQHGASYRDGAAYRLAQDYLAALGYGYLSVMSGYAFSSFDQGPASDSGGNTLPIFNAAADVCRTQAWLAEARQPDGTWLCQHRDPGLLAMLHFRLDMAAEPARIRPLGNDQLAVERGTRGLAVFNRARQAVRLQVTTGLPGGRYCPYRGRAASGPCEASTAITVNAAGLVELELPPQAALAIGRATRLAD